MNRPFGIHALSDMFSPSVHAGLPDGRYVQAVAEPYTANRLVAAWWVLTGRTYAMQWPKAGDLEQAIGLTRHRPRATGPARQSKSTYSL